MQKSWRNMIGEPHDKQTSWKVLQDNSSALEHVGAHTHLKRLFVQQWRPRCRHDNLPKRKRHNRPVRFLQLPIVVYVCRLFQNERHTWSRGLSKTPCKIRSPGFLWPILGLFQIGQGPTISCKMSPKISNHHKFRNLLEGAKI